jgi:hypothetical protein
LRGEDFCLLYLFVMDKAFKGERLSLPYIRPLAAKQVGENWWKFCNRDRSGSLHEGEPELSLVEVDSALAGHGLKRPAEA